ncbi:uncharacterized protein LOC103942213 isoform X1 [Pyrus x bretschneideri]|uniref:uncharacterized protein LOC103942213 isoform X1 n=1 Tax=Pyrus x bretschneideri TaxID=225117 RepID=UPI00202F1E26|nr:uncharacterized protein LOC103942213 isoform X1 [Pyrus x bretschneideri]
MGKALPWPTRFQDLTRIIAADKLPRSRRAKQVSQVRISSPQPKPVDPERVKLRMESSEGQNRVPLARVVSDCVRRWFQDTLKEAKAGDSSMQVLVGQMYCSGYGVPKDPKKLFPLSELVSCARNQGHAWMNKASKSRASVWKVSDKPPGYNASDSNSDELQDDTK